MPDAELSVFASPPHAPCPAPFNLAAHVLARAEMLGDKPAVIVVGPDTAERMTYAALRLAVLGTATGLAEAGFQAGDRILLRLGNSLDFPIAFLACLAAGLVPVPSSAALTGPEVARIVADLKPRLILRDPCVATAPGAPEMGLQTLRSLRARPPAAFDLGDPERLGYIVYTSGTSGRPRAVAHAHRAIWARQMMFEHWYDLSTDDVMMHAGAFNWTFTLGTGLLDPWTCGATALIRAPHTPTAQIATILADQKATIFAAAPGIYRQMLKSAVMPTLPHLRHGLSAGEKMAPQLHAAWQAATGTRVYEAFGMSECSTFISACPSAPCDAATIGRPQPGRSVAIIGPDGPVARGAAGIIAIDRHDPGLMLGYNDDPAGTADRFHGDWFLTGDIGQMSDTDVITFLGRGDDMMNAGGFRVSPVEVEQVVMRIEGVAACGAAEVPIDANKSIIVAFYTGPTALDTTTLNAHAAAHLARYKQPRAYVHLPALPTGPNGKLVRRQLPQFWPQPGDTP